MKTGRILFLTSLFLLCLIPVASATSGEDNLNAKKSESTYVEYTYKVYGDIPVVKPAFMEEHYMGAEIEEKWNTFLSNYTRSFDVSVGFSDSAVELVKPKIYNAVHKLNKHFKKLSMKFDVDPLILRAEMAHVLDCANVVCFEEDTKELEAALSKASQPEQLRSVFQKIKLVQ